MYNFTFKPFWAKYQHVNIYKPVHEKCIRPVYKNDILTQLWHYNGGLM